MSVERLEPHTHRGYLSSMDTQTYTVIGMTCQHCVASVTEEVSEIPGVSGVDVDLASGTVVVTAARPVSDEDVRSAVEEAGYQLA
jgi:copper ion binding protein